MREVSAKSGCFARVFLEGGIAILAANALVSAGVAVGGSVQSLPGSLGNNPLSSFKVDVRSLQTPSMSIYPLVPDGVVLNSDIFTYPGYSPLAVEDSLQPWGQHILHIPVGNDKNTDPMVRESIDASLAGCRVTFSSVRPEIIPEPSIRAERDIRKGETVGIEEITGVRVVLQADDTGVYALIVSLEGGIKRVRVAGNIQDFFQHLLDVLGEKLELLSGESVVVITIDKVDSTKGECSVRVRIKNEERWYEVSLERSLDLGWRLCGTGLRGSSGQPVNCPLKFKKPLSRKPKKPDEDDDEKVLFPEI